MIAYFGELGHAVIVALIVLAIVLVAWQAVVWSGWRPVYVLPGPDQVLPRLFADLEAV